MTTYLKVILRHPDAASRTLLYKELNDDRVEVRKVEIFADGRASYADQKNGVDDTHLESVPVPSLDDIAADREFMPSEISRDEFEAAWHSAKLQHSQKHRKPH